MKMFGKKSLSVFLYYVFKILAIASFILMAFILLSLLFNNYEIVNNQFQISLPLLSETYIKGFYETNIIVTISITLLFFSLFFYMLSNIFKIFKAPQLFTNKAIKQLNYFALINLVVAPILFLTIDFYIMEKPQIGNIYNYLLTFLLGIFLLFIATIFRKGYEVQSENDLTI